MQVVGIKDTYVKPEDDINNLVVPGLYLTPNNNQIKGLPVGCDKINLLIVLHSGLMVFQMVKGMNDSGQPLYYRVIVQQMVDGVLTNQPRSWVKVQGELVAAYTGETV